jgi:hypothetical protein
MHRMLLTGIKYLLLKILTLAHLAELVQYICSKICVVDPACLHTATVYCGYQAAPVRGSVDKYMVVHSQQYNWRAKG